MNHTRILAAAAGILLAATAVTTAQATGTTSSSTPPSGPERAPAHGAALAEASSTLKLLSTRVSHFSGTLDVDAEKVRLEPHHITVRCPGPSTCTLTSDPHVQIRATGADNRWAVCLHIRGAFMDLPCPWLGELPEDGAFTTGGYLQSRISILPGIYGVRSVVYVESQKATIYGYSNVYSVYSER